MKTGYKFRTETVRMLEVIELTSMWGDGTEEDPNRHVYLYFAKTGDLLAIHDPHHPHERVEHDRATTGM